MEQFPHVDDFDFYTVIKVIDKNRVVVEWNSWILPFHLSMKYNWYFRYRMALLQVKYPRFEASIYNGKRLKKQPDLEKNMTNKIRAAKSKVTEMKNKLEKAKSKATSELFGIEQEPIVINYKEKIKIKEAEVIELQNMSVKEFYEKFKDRFPDVDLSKIE